MKTPDLAQLDDTAIAWALAYAQADFPVFPVNARKEPLTGKGGFHLASTEPAKIEAWWRKFPAADIGWALPASIVVVDIDVKGGGNGFAEFEKRNGAAADTVATPQANSPTGGRHLYYAANGGGYKCSPVIGGVLDVKTQGGYIVLPSPGNGRNWLRPLSGPWADAPPWLPKDKPKAAAGPSRPFGSETVRSRQALDQTLKALATAPPGQRDAIVGKRVLWIGSLAGAGELEAGPTLAALLDAGRQCAGAGPEYLDKIRRAFVKGLAAPAAAGKLTIEIRVGEIGRVVDEVEAALIAADCGLYRRGNLIVAVGVDKMPTFDGKTIETQIIHERGDYALKEDIEGAADFMVWDGRKKKLVKCGPTFAIVRTLKDRGYRLRFPALVALTNCPAIKVDGALIDRPGFDPASGILFDPLGVEFPRIPGLPTKRDAEKALVRLAQLIATFDLVDEDSKAVALSLFLTAIARPGLPAAPLHGFSAPVAGTGKSKLVDLASILAAGHEAGVMSPGEDREEAEKRLSALLLRGAPLIAIDNCIAPLDGVLINQTLTQTQVELRILGQSTMVTTRCVATLTATGNNLVFRGDLTRRSLLARLDPKVAQPELRTFEYDPIADAKNNRGELVAAALTIMRAYVNAGRPDDPTPLGSFEAWSRTVRGPLVWLGAGDPIKTMERVRKADPTLNDLKAMMHAWRTANGETAVPARLVVEAAEEMAAPAPGEKPVFTRPELRAAVLAVAGRSGKISPWALGNWLAAHVDRIVDLAEKDADPKPYAFETAGERRGVTLWRLSPRKK
jgi:hypothetical protein